ncbi:tetratricopeptide repeat protein [Macrococcus armenti]|uniref:tetratricopeptide repeat protein n=1 Tax=Macrococcus armenti TaxID=2875764 RepID=UPI001CCDFB4D|nr:hypothetical protein [Macrococcus armenti]UBH13695.1 hypothetical protein LAU43_03110 [Macrococcus armenti]
MGDVIRFPVNEDEYYKIGLKKQGERLYEEAISFFIKSLNLNHKYDTVQQIANCFSELGKYEKAQHYLLEYLKDDFNEDDVFYDLSQLYIKQRDPNKAFLFGMYYCLLSDDMNYLDELTQLFEVVYKDVTKVEVESENFVVHFIFQYFFEHMNYELALEWIEFQPYDIQKRTEIRNLKAMTLLFSGKYNEASKILKKLLEENPADINALCHYTLLLYNTHQTELYTVYLKKLRTIIPMNDDEKFKLGIVLNFLKEYMESYQLLFPLYQKGKYRNSQMLHALSYSSYELGYTAQSDQFFSQLSELVSNPGMSPRKRAEGEFYIHQTIMPLLNDNDRYRRLIGIFLLSKVEDKTLMINQDVWRLLDAMPDYEKLYLSYIFHNIQLVKLDFIHKGLELIHRHINQIALMERWIDIAETVIEHKMELKQVNAYVAVCYFIFERAHDDKLSKRAAIELFGTTRYHFMKVYNQFKQINI